MLISRHLSTFFSKQQYRPGVICSALVLIQQFFWHDNGHRRAIKNMQISFGVTWQKTITEFLPNSPEQPLQGGYHRAFILLHRSIFDVDLK